MENTELDTISNTQDDTPIEPHDMLASVLPQALAEGAILINFKGEGDIRSAVIVTLHPEECPLNTCPATPATPYQLWAWNIRSQQWYLLDLTQIDEAMDWPPEDYQIQE